jgi:hypothetical protein
LDYGQIVYGFLKPQTMLYDTFFACFIQKYKSASEGYSQPFHVVRVLAQGRLQIWPLINPCNSSMS